MAIKKPYLKRKSREKKPFKLILFTGLFFCLLAVVGYFLIFSPYFWVKDIEIKAAQDPKYYAKDEIKEIARNVLERKFLKFFPGKSIFLVSSAGIRENILNQFPEIKSVEINRKPPHFLEAVIKERESVGIWCRQDGGKVRECFNIDNEGIIFKESPLVLSDFVLNLYASSSQAVSIRNRAVSSNLMEFILNVKEGLVGIKAVDFGIVSEQDLRVGTNHGFGVYFNPANSFDRQLAALETVLNEEIKDNFSDLEYIDLRIENRVYYR